MARSRKVSLPPLPFTVIQMGTLIAAFVRREDAVNFAITLSGPPRSIEVFNTVPTLDLIYSNDA